jgi:hypothetical protein
MQNEMKKAVKFAINEKDREYNVIMCNGEEQDSDIESDNFDADIALETMNSAVLDPFDGDFLLKGLVQQNADTASNRPLKIKFEYKSLALGLLTLSKNLKDDKNYYKVL